MRTGKLPEDMLIRSVLDQIGHRREEVLYGPAVGADCAVLETAPGEVLLLSSDPITGAVKGIGGHSIHITANDLAAAGAEPVAVLLTLLLPPETTEEEVRGIMYDAENICAQLRIEILGGHTEITPVVSQPVISVTGIGKGAKKDLLKAANVRPGMDLVVSKWIGLEAAAILAQECGEFLRGRVPDEMIAEAASFSKYLSVVPEALAAKKNGAVLMHDITEGGVLGALWEVAEAGHTGLEIDQAAIPVRKETQEICRAFSIDPLQVMSSGSLLIVAEDGVKITEALRQDGIPSAVVGRTTQSEERILRCGDTVSELTPPEPDALYTALETGKQKRR